MPFSLIIRIFACLDFSALYLDDEQALVSAIVKRIKGFIKLKTALSTLHGALPDATTEELQAYNDECAICRVRSFRIFLICFIYSYK